MNGTLSQRGHASGRARGGLVVPHQPTQLQQWAARAIYTMTRMVARSLRSHVLFEGTASVFPPQAIYVMWHNRLALCLEAYFVFARPHSKARGLAALVSASRDGGLLASVLQCYGVQPVRGSSSRRGPQALLELTSWAGRGYDLAITPDGPRGPRYVVQEGVIALAQLTGLPIVPASYSLSRCVRLKSWDGFLVPLPFARWVVILAPPLHVPREANENQREELRKALEQRLRSITQD
ncbi:MAG: lysophospholipid acyltransferase family protein [Verrucomicrobiota bacterium]|nr:lysophospholipid acyltransferase family protein [Limisphaera sp.]MDW8381024.1 lysophospholipid acyltransferase family protein [Verrucomicrobiota bacterium]